MVHDLYSGADLTALHVFCEFFLRGRGHFTYLQEEGYTSSQDVRIADNSLVAIFSENTGARFLVHRKAVGVLHNVVAICSESGGCLTPAPNGQGEPGVRILSPENFRFLK